MTIEMVQALMPTPPAAGACCLHLLDGPYVVRNGMRRELPENSQRLVAFLALSGRRARRRVVASALWPAVTDARASGNLRSALWRLRGAGLDVLTSSNSSIGLLDEVVVDVELVNGWAERLISGQPTEVDLTCGAWRRSWAELLPGWYEDWAIFERERLRLRFLCAMEAMSLMLRRAGRHAEAVEAAMAVIAFEPLRESAQRLLVEAHLAEGNVAEALRCYRSYYALASRELQVEPSPEFVGLLRRSLAPADGRWTDRHPTVLAEYRQHREARIPEQR